MDFTVSRYLLLIKSLKNAGYVFQTFTEYLHNPPKKVIILRHDVDLLPLNSLRFAQIQNELGISGTFYFRIVPKSFNTDIIKEISSMGHEIGYHYETMDTCRGNINMAYDEFCKNLEVIQKITPIKTISMHGSPLSKFDNRDIWKKYDYKKLGIIGEPYFDVDFNKLFYITDTGRRWDGHKYNVRDKATAENSLTNPEFLNLSYSTTKDIIDAIEESSFPQNAMINFHPQRWHNKRLPWIKELIVQNLKNQAKRILISIRK